MATRQSRPRTCRVECQTCNARDEHPYIEPSFDLPRAGSVLLVRKQEELSEWNLTIGKAQKGNTAGQPEPNRVRWTVIRNRNLR